MAEIHHQLPREIAAQYGHEAVRILDEGRYTTPSGQHLDLVALIDRCVRDTVPYPPDGAIEFTSSRNCSTTIEVLNITTLAAARRLLDAKLQVAVLNFASATHPGGGFLHGARAQEEYLARSSALYACLRDQPMYGFHRDDYDPLYSDYLIYSPAVPVFRGDDGRLLEAPYTVAIITAAAANANNVPPDRENLIRPAMRSRTERVLAAGLRHGHDGIVLGAWGCGAFGNDRRMMAELFREALASEFHGAYAQVIFAIRDWSPDRRFIGPFETAFAHLD